MDPFEGPISGPLNQLAGGSAAGSIGGATALGSSETDATIFGAFGLMPGWALAAIANNFGL